MCGIYGYVGTRFDGDEALLSAMDSLLRHRGPDEGAHTPHAIGALGMRRLAIIDFSGGSQPMSDASGRYTIVFNGEIYNYRALRDELRTRGRILLTESDTETVLHGFAVWGGDVVAHLSGMFAFAIFDSVTKRAFFARDHLGKKPLYFWQSGERLFFASEIKALLAIPGFERRIDLQALAHYLTLKHVPAPLSIFSGVRALPAGHRATFADRELHVEAYYAPQFYGELDVDEESAATELLERLRAAVRARMIASDVPVGSYLSGGLDSSLVAALAVEIAGKNIHTFSMGYREELAHKSDTPFARLMAARLGSEHHELFISSDDVLRALPDIVASFDEPFGGTISPYFLTELIAKHVKVAVSGDGADELFGSYAAHRAAGAILAGAQAPPAEGESVWRTHFLAFTDEQKRGLFPASRDLEPTAAYLKPYYESARGDAVNRTLEVEVRTLLPDGVLTYVDRLSMAHSVEVRAPFLDRDLVAFAGRLPGSLKVRPDATKAVLKRAALRILPREIVERPKVGFILPLDTWLGDRFFDLLERTTSARALSHGFFDAATIARYVAEQRAGTHDHTYRLWTLVMFQLWHEQYVESSVPQGL